MPEKRKRRWLQFSLRSLLVLTTVFAVWFGNCVHNARQQKKAVTHFVGLGGSITYEYQVDKTGTSIPNATPHAWMGLRDLIGGEYFDSVRSLSLWRSEITDEDLRLLRGLRGLKRLHLGRTQVTDSGMAHIGEMESLRALRLTDTEITDAGLEHLCGLRHLEELVLDGTTVTDEGMENLADLRSLESVNLIGTAVTEEGVNCLLEAGKAVACILDARLCALDEADQPIRTVSAGEDTHLLMTFNVPASATSILRKKFLFKIVGRRPDGSPVTMQTGFASAVQTNATEYQVSKPLHLKSPKKIAMPGELKASVSGVDVCVEPLDQIRPAGDSDKQPVE